MKRILQTIVLFIICLTYSCKKSDTKILDVQTILMDGEYLNSTKKKIQNKSPQFQPSFDRLIKEAEAALEEGPFSVTDKEKLPPSSDKHDYASYSRYWWPDPDQPDGMPYIRKDGETNPASQNLKESDRQRIGALCENVEILGLAYYFTGKEKYAVKAAELLRVWFIDDATRMNPNMNHAQCRPGHNEGSKSGVLDGRLMVHALEGSLLIANSDALSTNEHDTLKAWVKDYVKWLTTNTLALQEAASKNNHGSFYDAQTLYYALYVRDDDTARKIATEFHQNRILSQIKEDGSMPEEMTRTKPLFYSMYNLHAMFLVAHMAEQVDVDLWRSDDKNSRLRKALDYLAPYADLTKKWPTPIIGKDNRMEMFPILQMAEHAYPGHDYFKLADQLPIEKRNLQRENLAFPLMR